MFPEVNLTGRPRRLLYLCVQTEVGVGLEGDSRWEGCAL
jgi:hypothetical protein